MARKKKEDEGIKSDWITTYSDMVTLLLCFFVALFDSSDVVPGDLASFISAISNLGMGPNTGGNTLSAGKLAELGNTINTLPSMEKGRSMGMALKKAISIFNPDRPSTKVQITQDERGLVISLASDAFFRPASADINIEETRDILLRLAGLLNSDELAGKWFRIEGHTDGVLTDPNGPWRSNWELSTARSLSVLHYLVDLGVNENRFQVSGFGSTRPVSTDDTPEGRANNRRVDIVIIDDGHL